MSLSGNSTPTTTGNNFRLYLGNYAADIQICLFNQNNLSLSYGFGAKFVQVYSLLKWLVHFEKC